MHGATQHIRVLLTGELCELQFNCPVPVDERVQSSTTRPASTLLKLSLSAGLVGRGPQLSLLTDVLAPTTEAIISA